MFLLFYFADDLVSQKNGETQKKFCILQILFAYDIMSSDKEKLLFHSENKTPDVAASGVFIP